MLEIGGMLTLAPWCATHDPRTHVRNFMSKPVSIKDIARAAGVHHSTVSRALKGKPRVSLETAARIRRIAGDAGFTLSAVARSLATQRTAMIGVVVTAITDPFHHEIIAGLDEVATAHNYSVIVADSQGEPDREVKVVRSLHERRVDAIVVLSSRVGARYMALLKERRVPIVLVNNQRRDAAVHALTIDNVDASYAAVQHLIELGHRIIGYIGNANGVYSDAERLAGYRQAIIDARFGFASNLVQHAENSPEGGIQAMTRLLDLPIPPTGVFCYNDMMALGAYHAARGRAQVPKDVSIVGFDDLFFARYLDPPLTTTAQPTRRMGRMAMETALALLEGKTTQRVVHITGELIVRNSTAPPSRL
jgi:DNA-binding LacI/PurR family transcriptional regulator